MSINMMNSIILPKRSKAFIAKWHEKIESRFSSNKINKEDLKAFLEDSKFQLRYDDEYGWCYEFEKYVIGYNPEGDYLYGSSYFDKASRCELLVNGDKLYKDQLKGLFMFKHVREAICNSKNPKHSLEEVTQFMETYKFK